jgi:hypothetical protein
MYITLDASWEASGNSSCCQPGNQCVRLTPIYSQCQRTPPPVGCVADFAQCNGEFQRDGYFVILPLLVTTDSYVLVLIAVLCSNV